VKAPFTIYDLRFTICRKSAESVAFNRQFRRAFTLVELLVVISILGILAALTVPAIKNLGKSNVATSASRQLLDGVGRARQLAIADHTTVYMIFVPTNFWLSPYTSGPGWTNTLTPAQLSAAVNLCDKQLTGYTFVANGAAGDQPGRHTWHYLDTWQSLPDGSFIASWKFGPRATSNPVPDPASGASLYSVPGFNVVNVPFPTADSPSVVLPCIAFNYLGQLTTDGQNPASQHEYIPLARGTVAPAMDASKVLQFGSPFFQEIPPGNSASSAFDMVDVDPLTGRATLKFQKVQ